MTLTNLLQKKNLKKLQKKIKPYRKMDRKRSEFDNTEIEKYEFHQYKSPISINHIDID